MDRKNVEDLYLLSPLQQGMLFHTLYAPGSGAYVEQTVMVLGGHPRAAELRRAWQMVVERHPVLRTGFVWEGVPKPLQVVFRTVALPWEEHDWSGMDAAERDARWERFLAEDRARGFDLLRAPLMRFALVRTGPEEHRLLWTSHHILTDGWSLPIVLNDFAALYHGLLAGASPRLRPARPFRDYIAWLNRQDAGAAERYWTARLAGIDEPTPLPLDRAPALAGDAPKDHAVEHRLLPPESVAALDEAARRLRVTASAILQGAWAVVLARTSAVDDVVFGTTVSGRPPEIPGVGEIVGMFINTIPVRARVDDALPVDEWMRGLHREHAAAGEFEHAPLAEMQKWAGVHEKAGLFETLLVYENYPLVGGGEEDGGPPPEGALELTGMESTEHTDLPLSVAIAPGPAGMRLSATYDPRRLRAADARRLLDGLAEVVRQVTAGAVARVAELSPFTDAERGIPLASWSGAVTPAVCDTVPSLFASAAAAAPDAVAVRADDATLTYAQLDAAANRLARHLRAHGAGTDVRVGVSIGRSADLVVALLAILKAGAAYVPLDPSYPAERLAYMRRDADVALVLVDGDAPSWAADARVVSLAADRGAVDALPADDLGLRYDADALAYVIYTSGSTGQPKGVAVPHRAVVRLVRGADWVRLGAAETLLLLAPVAFDASTFEVWGALLNGGALAVHPPETPDPARLGAFLRERGVTTLWMTAGLFHQVVDADPSALAGVRQVLTGGDVVSPPHVRRVMEACPDLRVIDGYGPTENTTFTTTHTVRAEDLDRPSLPIGKPITGTQAYVVDGRMRPLPAGVPGELLAGGQGLARGYLGRPALTAATFVPDPFSGVPGARLYRTGDRVRWTEGGVLEFLGRMDQQVKVRGYRIEPGEVEAALKLHPHVGDAVVAARADGAGGKRLVAYVVPRDGTAPAPAELRSELAGRMPGHMVPSAFVVLEALPLTPNGKVDRRALPAPQFEAAEAGAAPATPTEEVLAGLWSELLGVDAPGRDDDFFHLGGHSLIATQLVSRARQAFSVELPLRVVFEAPTLAAMAEQVDRALRAAASGVAAPPLVPGAVEGVDLPLSFAQEGLWFIDLLDPGSSVYNVPFTMRLRGPLDAAALRRALEEIVRRHGALRSRFVQLEAGPVQRVLPPEPFILPVDDLGDDVDAEAEVRRRSAAWGLMPYDLANDPLIRARLLRLADEDHVLLVAMHHIVCDGWSMGVFWRELAMLYEAFSQGMPSPLPPLALQYGDFARWQRGWLTHDAVDAQAAWWREQMAGAPALLEIPSDRPRPAAQSHRGALLQVTLPAELAGAARALARTEGATLYMALVAAWSAVLSRWSGQDDVVVGTPIAGRTNHETEALIGLFVNTLPIRADLSGDPTFRALLKRVREATLGAYAHQDLPFERLVEDLQPGRSLSHTPLFQAMLAFNNTPTGEGAGLAGLRMEGMEEAGGVARTDLTLSFAPGAGGGLAGTLEYATDLWDRATMERLVAHFQALLRAAAEAPDTAVSALPMMADAERAEAIRLGAAAAVSHSVETTLHAAFAARVRAMPDAPAVTFGDATLTYGELDAAADRLARRLAARGAGPEQLVGLSVERSLETVIGILGILKAGAAYLPLDPAYPDDRLAYMLEDSGARVVLTTAGLADRLPSGVERVWLEDDADQPIVEDLPLPAVSPDGLAYVIYTSGSTGRPKGVQVTHANVVRLFETTDAAFGFGAGDVWTLFHSYAFDFSVWELWGALLYGGRLVVVPFEVSRDPARFLGLLRDERVTVLNQTPSAFRQLIRADEDAGGRTELALRCVVFGGEALDPASLRGWVERRGDERPLLVNMYGITETTVHVTHRVIREADVRAGSASPIGLPIPDLSVHLLDRRGQPAPLGVVGEMHVGGGGVARGYLGRPGLTAERFVPDPFGAPGSRLYRSGDLARRRADGGLEFHGRADDQVKVRGFRIELGEIESVLLEHPAVREAVVLARGAADDRRLVAWVVGEAIDPAALRAHLLAHLPEYMVPSAFVPLDALPLTRNGKVDRRALPDPDAADLAGAAYVAPRTPAEQVLASIWEELLGAERVGVADGFFDLGGHSLLATRVVSAVRGSFGVEVPVRAVFEHPTLEAFAAELERLMGAGTQQAPPLRPVPRDGNLPLSFAQERLWFVDRLEPGSPVYHMSFPYLLRGTLDVDALHRAYTEVVRRHETLRTSLPFTGEQPVQRIAPPGPVEMPLHDLSHLAEEERDAAARALMDDVANRPFDLERGPLHRAAVARLSADEHLLVFTLHHVISDGWTLGLVWTELSTLYTAFSRGEPSPLPELYIQYGDFAVWQRAWLTGDVLDAQLGYWRRKLAGAPPLLELPTDRPRPAVQTYAGAEAAVVLEGADAEAVLALGRREGSTLFMVLLAAMNVVFSRLAGQDDVVIGTPIAGRTRRETEGLVGLFLNSLALRTDLSGEPTFREVLRRVRETTLEAYAHQDLPFERILQELAPERSLSHSPLFQVMLNLANFAYGQASMPGVEVHGVEMDTGLASKFDLTVYAGEGPESLSLYLVYNTALFDADRARTMLEQMVAVLRQAAEDVERPVARMSLLTESARSVLPDPAAPLSDAWRGSVPEIFAAHAARTPDAVAVEDPAERWSYAELNASANAIAHRLMADGVRPGEVVAIHGHRSAALVRALMGTLRSGAAFLILDPAYPPARLAEYVRIARPTGWIPLHDAGKVPAELAEALGETVVSTLPLGARLISEVAKVAETASADSARGVVRAGGQREVVAATSVALASVAMLEFDSSESADRLDAANPPPVEIGPDSLAYLSFTSGTTGRPKAVMGRHGSLTHFTPWLAERFGIGPDDRFTLFSGLAHDPLHRDVFTPLQLGASIVAPDDGEMGEPGSLLSLMRDAKVTIAHLTPAMGQLLGSILPGETEPVESLRLAFFVGDVLTRTDVDRLRRLAPNVEVVNYYGSTETQRAVAHFVVPADTATLAKDIVPVGTGIPDVQVLIRTPAGERAGVGEVGEIWMRSPHVALGYLGDAELSAQRFVDGAYRTGDLGRYRPDGVAEVAGRADQQVKIRGFRIEPGEVEAVLRAHPAVRDTVVVARGEGDGRQLVAYVAAHGEAPAADAFRAHLKDHVPEYMVPSAWVFLDALPLTPNGKVDRRALPEPETSAPDAHVAPRTPTELVLAEIWAELLKAAPGVDDDFFALGGHSLLATRLVGRVRDALRVELPLRALFEAPTLAAMAARLDALLALLPPADAEAPAPASESAESAEATSAGGASTGTPSTLTVSAGTASTGMTSTGPTTLERAPSRREPLPHSRTDALTHSYPPGVYPLSFAQQRLWLLMQLGTSVAYNMSLPIRFTGPLDDWALERALDEIVRRHEALRTRIEVRDEEPVQVVQPPRPLRLRAEDVRPEGDESVDDALMRLATEEAARPFAAEGPFLRARLLRAAEEDHVLLWSTHHMIGDGWSLGVFQTELAVLYRSFVSGDASPLPPLPVQYGQHALEQRRALSGHALDALAGWWKDQLAGAPALLELPTDRPRPAEPSGEGSSFWFNFPEGTAERVTKLARSRGATSFMVLMAAFQALLSRWSGQDDVVIGTPIANRTRTELEGLIGFFANTLAIRGDVSGDPTFAALVERVRDATIGAYEHQDIPFERLVEELNPERSLSHSPVFQVMLVLQNTPGGEAGGDLEGLTISGMPREREAAKYDLTLNVMEHGGQLAGLVEYALDLFDVATMERLMTALIVLVDAALDQPETAVSALPLFDQDERVRLLDASAGPSASFPDVPLHAAFEAQAARTPGATALVFGTERVTYAELDARANRLAHLLRARGIGPDQPVAVLMERSIEMVVALYGILKAGAAYVPVDPEYPADRVAYMLSDSAAALVLTQARWMDGLDGSADALALDLPGVLDAFPAERPVDAEAAGTDRLAYVIYTSGSTGRPKGAMNAHRGVVNRIAWMQDAFALTPDDAVLQKTPFSFDVSVWEFFWPLAVGARLVIAPPGAHRDPVVLNDLIQREGITTLHFVPSMLRAWLDGADASDCASLRLVMSSGEALPADLVTRFFHALPSGQLHNLYGPTEAAVDVTHWPCTPEVRGSVPIGRPIANTRMYVLDPRGEPSPVGVPGELWIAGVQVGRGYWRRPGLTAERFVPDPFAPQPGARMYRTGDRARWLANGDLEYLGRTDFQVKVRGFRIEPGEIEAELAALPGVRQAVVDARTGPGGARLVAWIAAEGAQPSAAELRAGLLRSLPDHMVPSVFVPVESLPLTPSGKVDRRALPDPEGSVAQGGGYVPPRSPTEQLLAQAWSELLGVERVGASDAFFGLGGHSLLATRLVSRVREMFGVELPLRTVFEVPVLRDLAARIDRTGRDGDDPFAPPPLVPMAAENDAPLSFAQERLWFIDRLAPGTAAYNMSPSVRLEGEIDPAALERALAEVVRRHEPLRTAFVEVDEAPVQRVLPADAFRLEVEALEETGDADARAAEVARRAAELARAPFDLAVGPPFRARLIRIAPDDHVLLLSMHYAVSDGWSLGILFRELFALYDAFRAGEPSPLPPLPVRYADFAVWQRSWLRGEALERQLAYWRERLAGAPPVIRLPTDRPRPEVQSARGGSYGFTVPADVADSVRALARREGVTLFMALLAAWNVLLARASGDADVVVGTPIAGRTRAETEGLVGLFVNTLAVRTDLADDPDYRALLARVRETTLGAYAHQDLPFEKLVEELRPERSLGHSPVFQVMFVYQNTPDSPFGAPSGEDAAPVAREGTQAKVDLTLTMAEGPDGSLYAGLDYAAELFEAESMERMAGQLVTLLRRLAREPDAPVSALPLLADEERAAVDAWGRAADADLPAPVRVLDAHGEPVPAGIPGELCVADADRSGGDGPAQVADPFTPGVRLRRTGERVRWRGDGTLERLGAIDAGATVRERPAVPTDADESYVAPRTATETTVAAVWAELLGRERVGVNDTFFDLGGHSLLGTRVVSRLRDRLGVEVPLAALFAAPRLEDFAARVDEAARGGVGVRLPAIRRTEGDTAPPSFAQERLWFIDRLEPGGALYNMSPSLRLRGPLDPGAMADALREVVRRHEPLRTTLPLVDGTPVQRIGPVELEVPLEDLSHGAEREREEEVARRTAEWARMPFDLEAGPLFRARLLRIAPDDHVLLMAMHHAVSDGWSNGILFRELFALYDAFAAGRPSPLPPLPVRYADYAAWQREWLSGEELDRQVAYWREALAGAPALLELPGDRPRTPAMSRRGASHAFTVPADVADSVRALARRTGATLFMALLAAFDAVLARWSGQDDVVVGTPVAGRTRRETEGLIGLFVNTLALRTDLSGNPPFLALLERVREVTLGAFAHQDLPFEKLVEELQPERSLGRNPVFQVMFNLGNVGDGGGAAPVGLDLALATGKDAPDAKVDLALTVNEKADGTLSGFLDYPVELFESRTVERMAASLLVLLRAAAARPETPVADLPLFDPDERVRLLDASAGPSASRPDVPLHAAFEAQAARTPGATALVFGTERLTYAELDARANRLAHLLRARGIGPDQPVAVLMERSVEMVVALYGILKAGAAYVPVDPDYPADRVAYMLSDSAAALVLTQARWMDGLDGSADAVALDLPGVLDAFPAKRPSDVDAAGTDRLAYVIYTSGSTGRPKGAMNAHRGVVNRIAWMQDAFGLTPDDAVLQKTPFSFDVSVWEFFWPLAVGARLVIAPPGAHRDPVVLNDLIQREGITTLHFVPSMLRAWLDGADASDCTSLRLVMSSGEALPADLVTRFFHALPSGQLHNLYGPTEAAVDVTHWPCTPEVRGSVPIGRPIANTRMYVLDPRGEPSPVGVPGELWIAGVQVGRGYWRRPGLTAERFVPDPFATEPGARMYRTGDRARWLADGDLEYLGRTDFQVKVRGFRIEPGEIEAELAALPGVRQAVVDARTGPGGARLVAWIVAEGAQPTAAELRTGLLRSLPDHMVPSVFVPVESLPLTPSGKVDRRALPDPDHPAGDGYIVPRDLTELEVARIWSEALGAPRVGALDDFFRLGGHSLLALRVMSRVRERFGRDLPLTVLFQHSTVAAFADVLRQDGAMADDGRLLAALNPGGTLPPLIFFPPAGGTVTHYADLARLLGPDQPFLALQAPGVDGEEEPLGTMDAIVDRYLDEIRRAQPHGPYWLGGWSAGGVTAFEAARRLRDAGEEVALLAIVDAPAPDADRPASTPDRVALLRGFAASTVTGDEALLDALVAELRPLPAEERLPAFSRWIARQGAQVMDDELDRVGWVVAVFEATARAIRDYSDPPPIDVPVALFVASEGKAEDGAGPEARPARWRPFVRGEMAVRVIPGVHAELVLEPAAIPLADALREVMEQVRRG